MNLNTKGKINMPVLWATALFLTLLSTLVFTAPTQSGTYWRDNFSDSTGISTISNLKLYK